jgi:hypothetical protein
MTTDRSTLLVAGLPMLRYKLRTLLIVLALGPPVLAAALQYVQWRGEQARRATMKYVKPNVPPGGVLTTNGPPPP